MTKCSPYSRAQLKGVCLCEPAMSVPPSAASAKPIKTNFRMRLSFDPLTRDHARCNEGKVIRPNRQISDPLHNPIMLQCMSLLLARFV
jgi:hypothetical protein